MKNQLVIGGEKVQEVSVWVHYPRKRAPFKNFALLNLDSQISIPELTGIETKCVLALILNPKGLSLKEIAEVVGVPTTSASRALRKLLELRLAVKTARGHYQASSWIVHFGRWHVQNRLHPQVQPQSLETLIEQADRPLLQKANPLGIPLETE